MNRILLLLIVLNACNIKKQEPKNSNPIEKETTEKFINLNPIDSSGNINSYNIHGFQFKTKNTWKIQDSQGVDFVVTTFLSPNNNRFYCYFGWHPNYPSPIDWHIKGYGLTPNVLDSLKVNGHYTEHILASIEDGIKPDSTVRYRQDSMIFEAHRFDSKDLWIRKPLKGKSGPFDIGIIFHADSIQTKLHIFGKTNSSIETKKLIKIAESVKKL